MSHAQKTIDSATKAINMVLKDELRSGKKVVVRDDYMLAFFRETVRLNAHYMGVRTPSVDLETDIRRISNAYANVYRGGPEHGKTQITVGAALLRSLSQEALNALSVHELSHLRHRDVQRTLTFRRTGKIIGFLGSMELLVGPLQDKFFTNMHLVQNAHENTLLIGAIPATIAMAAYLASSYVVKIAVNAFARRNELRADKDAVKIAGIDPTLELLRYIRTYNEPKDSFAKRDHPKTEKRIRMAIKHARRDGQNPTQLI